MAEVHGFGVRSVWEVGHLWEGQDPNESSPERLLRNVRERVRQLLQGIASGVLNPYNAGGEDIAVEQFWFAGIRRKKLSKKLDHHLHQRIYHREFLESIFVRQDEVEKWCWRTHKALPAFWFPDQINRWGPREDRPAKRNSEAVAAASEEPATTRSTMEKKLQEDFFQFYVRGTFRSRAEAARRFCKSLPKETRRLLVARNFERTLTAALSKRLRAKGED